MYKLIEKKPAVILLVFQSPEEGLGLQVQFYTWEGTQILWGK